LGNAVVRNDEKTAFLEAMASWVENWSSSAPAFCLTKQTADALIKILRFQAQLIATFLQEDYDFVLTAKFQTDPVERRSSCYRQMSGRNLLVSLREVNSSEKLSCATR